MGKYRISKTSMIVLFDYSVTYKEGSYNTSGATHYPEGWFDFVENLKQIIIVGNAESDWDETGQLTEKAIDRLKQSIDKRVSLVREKEDNFNYNQFFVQETAASYGLYYDEYGNLIYAEILHDQIPPYALYFYRNELCYIEMGEGAFAEESSVSDETARYNLVMEDFDICLRRGPY